MKKRTLKKISAAVLAAVMVFSLSGCGSSGGGGSASKDDGKTTIKITRVMNNIASPDSEEIKKVQDAVNDYIADKLDVQVEITEYAIGEYADKCNLSLANKEIDMLWTASWIASVDCASLIQSNAAYDISDLLEESTVYGTMPASVWESSEFGGKNYFIPVYKEVAEGYDLMFRKDLVDKYDWDLDSVTELADIEPMLKDCLEEDTVTAPLLCQSSYLFYKFFLDQYDWVTGYDMIGVDKETGEVVNVVQTDEYRDFCMLMSDWAEKGYILEGDATNSNPSNALMSQYWGISWWTDVPNNAEANTRYGQEVEMVHLTDNWISSNTSLGSAYAISATVSEETAQACIDFLGLLYTDNTLADIFTFGIEGTDFDYDEDGYVVKKGDLFNHSAWESAHVRVVSLEEGEPADKVALYDTFNDDSVVSVASGFRLDKEPIEAQLTACANVLNQYGQVLENGGYRTDEVDAMLETYQKALDEAGFQDVLDEVSRQFEEWKEG